MHWEQHAIQCFNLPLSGCAKWPTFVTSPEKYVGHVVPDTWGRRSRQNFDSNLIKRESFVLFPHQSEAAAARTHLDEVWECDADNHQFADSSN